MSFIIKSRNKQRPLGLNEPLRHAAHKKPVTRRDFLAQGFISGAATVIAPSLIGALIDPRQVNAATLSADILALKDPSICAIAGGAKKIPFVCFDLAGGANIAGSNVLVGKQGGQLDFLTTQGYAKLGLPGGMLPNNATTNFVNTEFGLAFHADSAFLRGMQSKTSATTRAFVNGAVIPARSENDTSNNPHNPMYGIAKAGAKGELLTLIGSQNSDSGGNSIAPAMLMDPANRPTKIDRRTDVTGLVDTGEVARILEADDTVRVLETMVRVTKMKVGLNVGSGQDSAGKVGTALPSAEDIDTRKRYLCSYVKTADTVNTFGDPAALDPAADPEVTSIFGANFGGDGEFQKTASVMKLVVEGNAGAGTISMGGFDYHTGDRSTGEQRDFRAGQCIGAVLEFAALRGKPVMVYVFSDGSLSASNMVDDSAQGRGKLAWQGDNQQTASVFFLVYNPGGRPTLLNEGGIPLERRQQLGYFRPDGDVETAGSPAANNINLLVQSVILNYMALHGESSQFASKIPAQGLGSETAQRTMIAFNPICNGLITNPV